MYIICKIHSVYIYAHVWEILKIVISSVQLEALIAKSYSAGGLIIESFLKANKGMQLW